MGTLFGRQMTRVHPVVSFTLIINYQRGQGLNASKPSGYPPFRGKKKKKKRKEKKGKEKKGKEKKRKGKKRKGKKKKGKKKKKKRKKNVAF